MTSSLYTYLFFLYAFIAGVLAQVQLKYKTSSDGGYGWSGFAQIQTDLSEDQVKRYAQTSYDFMRNEAMASQIAVPAVMAALWVPLSPGGHLIIASSVKGSPNQPSEITEGYCGNTQ